MPYSCGGGVSFVLLYVCDYVFVVLYPCCCFDSCIVMIVCQILLLLVIVVYYCSLCRSLFLFVIICSLLS